MAQHASKLSPGQLELFKKVPGYRMDVYPTRRTCGAPDFVAENTKQNVGFAKLDAAGVALEEAHVPGIPFPMPSTGAEVMWNMKMRYRGVGVELPRSISGISPRKGGEWLRQSTDTVFFTPWGKKGSALFSSVGRLENATFFNYQEPAALAGQAAVQTAVAGEQATTFYYFPGQRRVRRMPSYSYDAPQIGLDNQYTVDEANVFFGAMDRFDWKLLGKQELLVPYNVLAPMTRPPKQRILPATTRLRRSRVAMSCIASGWSRPMSAKACATRHQSACSTSTRTAGTP